MVVVLKLFLDDYPDIWMYCIWKYCIYSGFFFFTLILSSWQDLYLYDAPTLFTNVAC